MILAFPPSSGTLSADAVTPGPTMTSTASTRTQPVDDRVSPGLPGFLTMFLLALAVILLVRSMVTHLRRVSRNAARLAAEEPADGRAEPPSPPAPPDGPAPLR